MQELDLLRQIITSCDEALRDVFLRRMEASVSIARSKLSRGESVYSYEREQEVLRDVVHGLSPELSMKAASLWKSLLRMSRNRQYRIFLEADENLHLAHECDMVEFFDYKSCCCTGDIASGVNEIVKVEPCVSESFDAAVSAVENGKYDCCAVKLDGVYKTDFLFSVLSEKKLYLNKIAETSDGLIAIISSKLQFDCDSQQIISAVFNMSSQSGSLASILSVLADNRQNMEFLHMEKCDAADDMHQFRLFINFDGNLKSTDTRAAIYQLESELPFFRIVGARNPIDA